MKRIVTVSIVILVLAFLVIRPVIEGKIADSLYPTNACGTWSSGGSEKICECSGLRFTSSIAGSTKTSCLGTCSNCRCFIVNRTIAMINRSAAKQETSCE